MRAFQPEGASAYRRLQRSCVRGGAFGYNLATGVTVVVATTKGETSMTDKSAFDIFRQVVQYVTPASPINF